MPPGLVCMWLMSLLQWYWFHIIVQVSLFNKSFKKWCLFCVMNAFCSVMIALLTDLYPQHLCFMASTELTPIRLFTTKGQYLHVIIDNSIISVQNKACNPNGHWINICLLELNRLVFAYFYMYSNKTHFIIFITRLMLQLERKKIEWGWDAGNLLATTWATF